MTTQTLTFSSQEPSPEAPTHRSSPGRRSSSVPFPSFFSPSPAAVASPPLSLNRQNALSPLESAFPPRPPPTSHPNPASKLLSEYEVIASACLPEEHRPTVLERLRQLHFTLTTHNRTGKGFHASGATHADRLVAAEQVARMSMVHALHVDMCTAKAAEEGAGNEDDDQESESLATDMLDASLCASGWRGTFDQPVFVTPLCLLNKETEVAELTSSCLSRFQRTRRPSSQRTSQSVRAVEPGPRPVPAPSVERILKWWQQPSAETRELLHTSARQRAPVRTAYYCDVYMSQRDRSRTHADVLHAAEVSSATPEDVDREVWNNGADRARSPSREMDIVWPPSDSLQGYCLVDEVQHRVECVFAAGTRWLYEAASHYFRKALHLWCLRCYRLRRKARGSSRDSQLDALSDAAFMLFGIVVVLAVEMHIAWTDERVPEGGTILEKVRMASSLFLEAEVQEEQPFGRGPRPDPAPSRRRAISCPF